MEQRSGRGFLEHLRSIVLVLSITLCLEKKLKLKDMVISNINFLVLSEPTDLDLSRIVAKNNYSDIQLQFVIKRKTDSIEPPFSSENMSPIDGKYP